MYRMPRTDRALQASSVISIVPATATQFFRRVDELVDIHLAAMNYSPQFFAQRKSLWLSNLNHSGFLCHLALVHAANTPPNINDMRQRSAAVCFSFTGTPHTWWYQQVFRGLRDNGHSPTEARNLLTGYAELSEIHVSPHLQGRGIGHALLRQHLSSITLPKAMLSTPEVPEENNGAWKLYRKLGFTDVLRNFTFPADDRPFAILQRATNSPS